MPFVDFTITPSVNVEKTPAANEMGVSDSSFIRWRDGMPEKIGGWKKYIQTQFSGVINAIHPWRGITGTNYLGVGTTAQLAYVANGETTDITPQSNGGANYSTTAAFTTTIGSNVVKIKATGCNLTIYDSIVITTHVSVGGVILYGSYPVYETVDANNFRIQVKTNATGAVTDGNGATVSYATTSGSAIIVATLNNHGYQPGDYYPANVAATVGGVTIPKGTYLITAADTNTFTFQAPTTATSSTSGSVNGGNMKMVFYTTKQPPVSGSGFGVNDYGEGPFGAGVTPTGATGTGITGTDYWLDNWGEILLACPSHGPIFLWSPSMGLKNATLVKNAPVENAGMCVVMPQQQIMAWGTTYNGISDPLQIRWSNAGDYTDWNPDVDDQAGGYHIPTGSLIQRVIQASQQVLVFTDIDVYAGQYVGGESIWGFSQLSTGCGLISPRAVERQGGGVYWMSQKNFYVSGGNSGVNVLPCSVWDAVFQDMNTDYVNNIVCASNAMFNEIVWYYPSASSAGPNDSYVKYNTLSGVWDMGELNRTAWTDQSILGAPIGASGGYLYQHETSKDADGEPIVASFKTGYGVLSNAQDMMFCDLVYPDFRFESYDELLDFDGAHTGTYTENEGGTVSVTFWVKNYLGDMERRYGPYHVNARSPWIQTRFRGRYVSVEVKSEDLGSFWRLGKMRFRLASDGRQ